MREYKMSEYYNNLSKTDKRKNNEKSFKEKIMSNIEMKKYNHERYKEKRSVIVGWVLKKEELVIIDE